MKNKSILLLLFLSALVTTGFDWGFGSKDKCGEAKKLAIDFISMTSPSERAEVENRILQLCPNGAATHFIKGSNLEKGGNVGGAVVEYGESLKDDPEFAAASGNLGLIHLQQGLNDEAAAELVRAVKLVPSPHYYKGLAGIFSERRLYSLALYYFGEAAKLAPGDTSLHVAQAEIYGNMGRLDSAEEEYSRALAAQSSNQNARLGLAKILIRKNRIDRAIEELRKVQRANPQDKEIHRLLAGAYEKKADWKSAEAEYLLAGMSETGKPGLFVARTRKGDEYLNAREYDKAVEEYRGALKEKPESAEALQKLGDALAGAGRDNDALAAYREALRINEGNGVVYYSMGLLYEKKGLLDEAVVEYRQSLKFLPESSDTRRHLAEIYTMRGSFPQAIDQYLEILKIRKNDPQIHFKLAKAYLSNKNLKGATEEFKETIRLDPDLMEAHLELANLYKRSNQTEIAVNHYREVLRLKKDETEARNSLTSIYVKNKNYDDLITLLKENVELNPKDPNSHYKLGLVYEFRKNYENAEARYKETVELKADHAKALNALGRIYMKTGRINEAKEALEASKSADPDLEETTVLLSNVRDEIAPEKYSKKKRKSSIKGKSSRKGKSGKKVNLKKSKSGGKGTGSKSKQQ